MCFIGLVLFFFLFFLFALSFFSFFAHGYDDIQNTTPTLLLNLIDENVF